MPGTATAIYAPLHGALGFLFTAAAGGADRARAGVMRSAACWLVLAAAIDIAVTMVVLALGGDEANPLAKDLLGGFGMPGMTALKIGSVGFVIGLAVLVEGRSRDAGRRLLLLAAVVTAVAPAYGLAQITYRVIDMPDGATFAARMLGGDDPRTTFGPGYKLEMRAHRLAEQRAVEREFALLGVEPALTEEGLECFPEHEVVFWEVDAPDVLIGVAEE